MAEYGYLSDHADAFMQYLYDEPDLTVYPEPGGGPTTVPPTTPPPYVAVQIIGGPVSGEMQHGRQTRTSMTAYCHCVGATDAAARIVVDLVDRAVLGRRPEIPGRFCERIRREIARDPLSSDTTGATTVTYTVLYVLESEPGVGGS